MLLPVLPNKIDSALPTIRVAEAIRLCNTLLDPVYLSVEGEVANFTVSRGAFVFFDLKDEQEDVRISCFIMAKGLTVPLEDGMRVVIEGRPRIHAKSGKFSLTVSRVEPKGQGSLKRAFDLLLAKLRAEGLFAPERKRSIPLYPTMVGVISSAEAAGYGDFMKIIRNRLPGATFIFTNVAVQGRDAESEICEAFQYLNSRFTLDAVVLIRGGGSMEDLHAFNSERVARAIVSSKAPVIVGIGHERDSTIADFCADLRAATPSNAAQLLLPTVQEVRDAVQSLTALGRRRTDQTVQVRRQAVQFSIRSSRQRIIDLVSRQRDQVRAVLRTVEALAPEQTLKRGYSITRTATGKIVRSVSQVRSGELIITQIADGTIHSISK
ncbi:exodeoxyribonuclease VII large subunit [Patescibacteria group bacterium]|nr:exodeoxyribonuclease VII large subunit [Patescibacteria group bacterium]